MVPKTSRRNFMKRTGATAITLGLHPWLSLASLVKSAFRLAVITDEISQDFDHACAVASQDFGLEWVELREMWGKNLMKLSETEVAQAIKILDKYKLRVTDIASPLFKTNWPGAPTSKYSPKNDSFGANFGFKQQDEVLERSIARARQFKTDRIRCFDFWRLDDQTPYRKDINSKLLEAANTVGKQGLLLVLENEFECNTATGREAASTLAAVQTPHLMLNWDPANAVARGEVDAYPAGYAGLPKNRIGHCHCKDAIPKPEGKFEWAAVGQGIIDWGAQFHALKQDGYRAAVSLETHWHGPAGPEASSRSSMEGMKQALQKAGALG
jgi:sugar phosphate isomerase/epimerase